MATIFMVYQELGAKASMADLNLMAIFARVVEAGSFSEAARRMGCSRSAVSKAVAKLENRSAHTC
jgi:molybdenum-dependent DNA-binding transcriptional regulator ModE